MRLLGARAEVGVTGRPVAWVEADETRLSLEASGSVALPGGARGFASPRAGGRHDLLLVLPPGTTTRLGSEPPLRGAALLAGPAAFFLDTPQGRHRCIYTEASRRQTATEAGVARCGICREPLAAASMTLRCPACGVVACSHCAAAAQCTRCGEVLDGNDE